MVRYRYLVVCSLIFTSARFENLWCHTVENAFQCWHDPFGRVCTQQRFVDRVQHALHWKALSTVRLQSRRLQSSASQFSQIMKNRHKLISQGRAFFLFHNTCVSEFRIQPVAQTPRRNTQMNKLWKRIFVDAPCRVTFICWKTSHRNALYDENRTGSRAWAQIVQTHFPQYGGIIAPPRAWRQIVLWIVFF
jgi:hypothetical protein